MNELDGSISIACERLAKLWTYMVRAEPGSERRERLARAWIRMADRVIELKRKRWEARSGR